MRSKIAQRIFDQTPAEVHIFVRKHSDIVVRVHQLIRDKGWTQKDLANRLEKTQSEVSKWLSGKHNFTLKSIAKLEAELGEDIIHVPRRASVHVQRSGGLKSTIAKPEPVSTKIQFKGNARSVVAPANNNNPDQPFAA